MTNEHWFKDKMERKLIKHSIYFSSFSAHLFSNSYSSIISCTIIVLIQFRFFHIFFSSLFLMLSHFLFFSFFSSCRVPVYSNGDVVIFSSSVESLFNSKQKKTLKTRTVLHMHVRALFSLSFVFICQGCLCVRMFFFFSHAKDLLHRHRLSRSHSCSLFLIFIRTTSTFPLSSIR